MDNFLVSLAQLAGKPGKGISFDYNDPRLLGTIGAIDADDVIWACSALTEQELMKGNEVTPAYRTPTYLTLSGWQRVDELKRSRVASHYAFFARQFDNPDLDQLYEKCLRPSVAETGYDLRTVTQRAGLIDAIIEDEIRRCKFLIADLSDDNSGAYWEAGFAEGLGKPVFYICRQTKTTHFDTDHRHRVRWDLGSLDKTASELKAVIRNTLLGDAKQPE